MPRIHQTTLIALGSSILAKSSGFVIHNTAAVPAIARSSSSRILGPSALDIASIPKPYHGRQTRLFMNFFKDLFASPEKSSHEEILEAFHHPKAVVIDVRSPQEITTKIDAKNWMNIPGSPFECAKLSNEAETLFPDKRAPIILHSASGKRSAKAESILIEMGYEQVFNAGGIGEASAYLPVKSAV